MKLTYQISKNIKYGLSKTTEAAGQNCQCGLHLWLLSLHGGEPGG